MGRCTPGGHVRPEVEVNREGNLPEDKYARIYDLPVRYTTRRTGAEERRQLGLGKKGKDPVSLSRLAVNLAPEGSEFEPLEQNGQHAGRALDRELLRRAHEALRVLAAVPAGSSHNASTTTSQLRRNRTNN